MFFIMPVSYSQCNDSLVQIAVSESGSDAFFLKEFKVKLSSGNPEKPAPVAKFSAYLKEGVTYRFNVADAKEYEGKLVLQLFKKGKMLGSTLNLDSGNDLKRFDFKCDNTATYQVLMSFINGKAGCAVGILSVVVKDSSEYSNKSADELSKKEILYIGIENELNIATNHKNCRIEPQIDKGILSGKNGKYQIQVFEEGEIKISVKVINIQDSVVESSVRKFEAQKLPVPGVTVAGISGGLIYKDRFLTERELKLSIPDEIPDSAYEIVGFTISDSFTGISGKTSNNAEFTPIQRKMIQEMKPGNNLYIKNTIIRTITGDLLTLQTLGFILQ
jgi:hypothetical protein